MRKYFSLFFSVTLLLSACKEDKTPAGVISKDRMTNLLIAVHLVDGGVYTIPQNPDSLFKYGPTRYEAVFKKFHTDSAQFNKSFRYYASQPDVLQKMYDEILENLKQKTDSLNKIQQKQYNAIPKK